MWGLYGWYCGLMCAGSCCGAVAWAAWMQYVSHLAVSDEISIFMFIHRPMNAVLNASTSKAASMQATALYQSFTYLSVYPVPYALEFLCFIVAKLMLMNRLASNAVRSLQAHAQEQGDGRSDRVRVGALLRLYRVIAAALLLDSQCCLCFGCYHVRIKHGENVGNLDLAGSKSEREKE